MRRGGERPLTPPLRFGEGAGGRGSGESPSLQRGSILLIRDEERPTMKTHRLARVAEAVREVASETILFELRDPRVKGVTVTRAEVSGDLQHAKVFVSVMGSGQEQKLCLYGLKHASGYIQSKLAKRL